LHIIAVIAWMAGMLYLPRLYAYHTETAPPGTEFDAHFQVWERKLLRIIINPAMTITWVLGVTLILWHVYATGAGWGFL
ncbi:CopD family protein, partial [Staphylococcus aureus]|nr:CopD family protein [Staphylococcus aureus]